MEWYPSEKEKLVSMLDKFLNERNLGNLKDINGLIVPHAGYEYSGKIAGKAYSILKNSNPKKALILSPNHYFYFRGILSHNEKFWETPLGRTKIICSNFEKADLKKEHSIGNQVPFLQRIGIKEILPLSVGKISIEEAKEIAEKIENFDGKIIVSTDLSHFLPQEEALKKDKETVEAVKKLDISKLNENCACGIYPLIILMELCKIKNFKPKLIEYKTSGDIAGEKRSVVGYASFIF